MQHAKSEASMKFAVSTSVDSPEGGEPVCDFLIVMCVIRPAVNVIVTEQFKAALFNWRAVSFNILEKEGV